MSISMHLLSRVHGMKVLCVCVRTRMRVCYSYCTYCVKKCHGIKPHIKYSECFVVIVIVSFHRWFPLYWNFRVTLRVA